MKVFRGYPFAILGLRTINLGGENFYARGRALFEARTDAAGSGQLMIFTTALMVFPRVD